MSNREMKTVYGDNVRGVIRIGAEIIAEREVHKAHYAEPPVSKNRDVTFLLFLIKSTLFSRSVSNLTNVSF